MNKLLALLSGLLNGKIAFDGEDGWITMNGTPVKVDDKGDPVAGPSNVTGKPAGESSNATSISITGNELGSYADAKELRQKAVDYYKANLQGKPANRSDIGEIRFSGKGLDETRYYSANPDKLLMLPALRGIIETGTLGKEEKLNHPRKDGIVSFIPITKSVNFKGKSKEVEALIGKDRNGNLYYDLFLDGKRKKESPASSEEQNPRLAGDSMAGVTPVLELNINIRAPRVNGDRIAFDHASRRHFDANGFLHVSLCHISKEQVADYYGSEIPGWQKLGLDPNRIYKGFRPGPELAKAAATFNGLPLLNEHMKDSAEEPLKDLRIGNLGTDAAFRAPYLDNSLIIQDAEAIEALNPSELGKAAKRELSASYRYDPVFKPGVFQGQRYDFTMTNIRGNHVALVEEGRAGSDVVVSDENTIKPRGNNMDLKALLEQLLSALSGGKAPDSPGTDTDTPPEEQLPASDNDSDVPAEDGDDFADRLAAHVSTMEDKDLAAKLAEVIEAVKTAGLSADEDPDNEDDKAKEDPPAMDGKKKRPAYKAGPAKPDKKTGNVVINMAMDAKAVAAEIREGFKAQIEAARDVRPLIGDVDPLAFDSAAGIYGKALELIGKPSKLTDPKALKELCALACDAKRGKNPYPVVSSVLANDSKGDADPAFANLGKIRKA